MYFLICSNVDDTVTNFKVCKFMEKIQKPTYLQNEAQFFAIVKKIINCTLKAILQQKIVLQQRQHLRSANNIYKNKSMKMSLTSSKNRMCQIKYSFPLYWWMLIHYPMNDKSEIYRLSCSVQIFKCFKWDAFKTIFYMKNEVLLDLFNFYGTLHFF